MLDSEVKVATTDALKYTAQDCYEAIQANPDNPKVPEYFRLRKACLEELGRRGGHTDSPAHRNSPDTSAQQNPVERTADVLEEPSSTHIIK
jgi:hypothetical protein